jgi:hypothetical protein
MKLIHRTRWQGTLVEGRDFERVGPGLLRPLRSRFHSYLPTPRQWAEMAVYQLLRVAEAALFFATLGFLSTDVAAMWLFSRDD